MAQHSGLDLHPDADDRTSVQAARTMTTPGTQNRRSDGTDDADRPLTGFANFVRRVTRAAVKVGTSVASAWTTSPSTHRTLYQAQTRRS